MSRPATLTPNELDEPDEFDEPDELPSLDYRANPSAGQSAAGIPVSTSRDNPNPLGQTVPPVTDRTIQTYDLPDQLTTYDRTKRSR